MHSKYSLLTRTAGLVAGGLLALTSVAQADESSSSGADSMPEFTNNYITLSAQVSSPSGDKAAYQKDTRNYKTGVYGIEDMRIGKQLSKDSTMQFDGHLLTGTADYLGKFTLSKDDVGTVQVGYKRFRTYYDGVGGFFPINQQWNPLPNEALATDRASFWADVTINLPNAPVFHIRYSNELRDGQKDSTIWGDTDLTGIPVYSIGSFNPISSDRKIVPGYMQIDERQQTLEATMTQTVNDNTTVVVSVVGNRVENLDTRYMNRYPGELKPYPAIPSSPLSLIPGTLVNNPIWGYDQQGNKTDSMIFSGKVDTQLNEKVALFAGIRYEHGNGDLISGRLLNMTVNTKTGPVTAAGGRLTVGYRGAYTYQTVAGEMRHDNLAANFGAHLKPVKDLFVDVALKGEQVITGGYNILGYTDTLINQATGSTLTQPFTAPNNSHAKENSWIPEIDVRYNGIQRVSLYGSADYRYTPGYERASNIGLSGNGTVIFPSYSGYSDNVRENHGHYRIGANWVATDSLTFRAETFYKDHRNSFADNTGATTFFVLGYDFYGVTLSATAKATPTLTFTTRYIGQVGQMDVTTDATAQYQSMDSKNHIFGETVDWNPNKQVYVQGNVNVVFDTTSTSYPSAGGNANVVLQNADNNYWDGNVVVGFVMDKDTDVQLEGTYYRANNYNPSFAFATVPYGAGVKEYTMTAGIKHKITATLVANAKVGYYYSENETTGGMTNYKGPLAYVGLTQAF